MKFTLVLTAYPIEEIDRLTADRADLQATFELRRAADMRAIRKWREATGRELCQPDHADLVVWLLERLAEAEDDARLSRVLKEVVAWGIATFPESTDAAKTNHLRREVEELHANPCRSEEMADVLMILAHLADSHRVDLADAVEKKLEVCRTRTWGEAGPDGVVEHVREEEGGQK